MSIEQISWEEMDRHYSARMRADMEQRRSGDELPNYLAKIEKLHAQGFFPGGDLSVVIVRHDDWCGSRQGGRCDCDPEIWLGMGAASKRIA